MTRLNADGWRALRILAAEQDTTLNALAIEAFNDLLKKHGKKPSVQNPLVGLVVCSRSTDLRLGHWLEHRERQARIARGRGLMGYGSEFQGRPTSLEEHQTTNLGVRSSKSLRARQHLATTYRAKNIGLLRVLQGSQRAGHTTICMSELAGNAVEMRRVPVRSGGKPVRRPDGTVGVIYDEAPEAKAFDRWQRGQFREIERDFAFGWRKQILEADDELTAKLARQILAITQEPKNLADALAIAKQVLQGEGQRFLLLKTAYVLLGLDPAHFRRVQARWVLPTR